RRGDRGGEVVARSRQRITLSGNPSGGGPAGAGPSTETPTQPVTSDAEILARLPAVRVVISDRETPGQAHFLVDEESFRRAFGVAAPVTPTDLSAVGLVAASQLRRELLSSRERVLELEAELGRLRFRINMTLLLLGAVVLSVFLQRRADGRSADSPTAPEGAEAGPEDQAEPSLGER
ncbi:MAG: hypothetical protein AAF725_28125, partial [Acidobacteriota bacterium]